MTVISYLYQKLHLLKLPVITVLLIILWLGISFFVVIIDINNQHKNLVAAYESNLGQQKKVLQISKTNSNISPSDSKESLNQQLQEIQNTKQIFSAIKPEVNFDQLKPRFESDKARSVQILNNNTTKVQLQICQGNKINEINQALVEVSKVDIKPYSKSIIKELEASFGQINSNLTKAIDSNNQLIRCLSNSGSSFVSRDNYYALIRFSKYMSGINKIYNRILETLKEEDKAGLDAGLNLIKAIDIKNFVTLKPGFTSELEKSKNQLIEKNIIYLTTRIEQIKNFQINIKTNSIINFNR